MRFEDLQQFGVESYYCTRHQLRDEVYRNTRQAIEKGCRIRAGIDSYEKLSMRVREVRRAFLDGLGGIPLHITPRSVINKGSIPNDGWHIEKLIIESRPSTYITANLYVPEGITAPRAAVLMACGHAKQAKAYPEYQEVCQKMLRKGFVVLCFDPIGQGERLSYLEKGYGNKEFVRWGSGEHDYAGWQYMMAGGSLARLFLEDAMCALTYLASRPEVDSSRVGMTGNSGGGTQTSMMMLADDRLAAAAPGTFITSREEYMLAGGAQDMEQIWYGIESVGFDHTDILLGMCAKPVCVLAVKYDFFPIEGTRKCVRQAQEVLRRFGQDSSVQIVEDSGTHAYTPALADAAAEFFANVLHESHEISGMQIHTLPASELDCTPSGRVQCEFGDSRIVYDETKALLGQVQHASVDELRRRVFNNRKNCDVNLRLSNEFDIDDVHVVQGFYFTRDSVINSGYMFRSHFFKDKRLPLTIALWDDGDASLSKYSTYIRRECRAGRAVFVVNISGIGSIHPMPINQYPEDAIEGTLYKLSTDLLFLGDSLPAVRTYDLIRSLDALSEWPDIDLNDIKLYSRGTCSIYARFAARLDKRFGIQDSDFNVETYMDVVAQKYHSTEYIHEFAMPGLVRFL